VPIDQLPEGHPARAHLTARGYDVGELAEVWGVGCCVSCPSFRRMAGRVYVPVHHEGVLVGWQGRRAANAGRAEDDEPKYYTMPGLQKGRQLYGRDVAVRQPLVVVCEGCSDVWRVGPPGVALLGKTASADQVRLLADSWLGKHAVVLLDGDAAPEAGVLADRLRPFFRGRLVLATLPDDLDPGDCPREDLWAFLRAAAVDQGVELPAPEGLTTQRTG
jgi:hypothetical protein